MSPELRQLADLLYDNVISTGVYHIKVGGSINETLVALMKVGAYALRDHLKATGGWDSVYASLAENEVPVMTALMTWFMSNPDADHIPAHAALSEFPPGPVQEFIDRHYRVDIEPGQVAAPLTREWIAERYAHAISHQKIIKRVVDHIDNMSDAKSAASTAQAQAAADALGLNAPSRQPLTLVQGDDPEQQSRDGLRTMKRGLGDLYTLADLYNGEPNE
jgi:hypothetical protein